MSLQHLATNSVIVTRLTSVSGYKKIYATVTGAKVTVQPISASKANLYSGAMGKTFQIYCDGTLDIDAGDRLRDISTGDIYQVKTDGVVRRTMGNLDHSEVIVEKIS